MSPTNPWRHPPGVPRCEQPRAEGRFFLPGDRRLGPRRRLRAFVLNGPKIIDAESILVEMIPRMSTKVSASGTVAIWPLAGPST
jgi:hypothetical protein